MTDLHHEQFIRDNLDSVSNLAESREVKRLSQAWINAVAEHRYTYLFESLGRPIIQFPQDMVALQTLIWNIKPDLIIETGIAHGGSLIQSASCLALIDLTEAIEAGAQYKYEDTKRKVIGIDIDIRDHNRIAIESHPMSNWITMIEGSSIDPKTVDKVSKLAQEYEKVLVLLDSNHTAEHVLQELKAYSGLVTVGSYCIVYDTVIEDMPPNSFPDRPWGVGNNPMTAVFEFLRGNPQFEIDLEIQNRLQISVAPNGYLRRI